MVKTLSYGCLGGEVDASVSPALAEEVMGE